MVQVLTKDQGDHGWQESQTQNHGSYQSKAHGKCHWLKDDALDPAHKKQWGVSHNNDASGIDHGALHFTRCQDNALIKTLATLF